MVMIHRQNSLQSLVSNLREPPKSLRDLPLAHLNRAGNLDTILNTRIGDDKKRGALTPRRCEIFNKELLYFSYGGIFHRHKADNYWKTGNAPIAFLFHPQLLSKIDCYYPYDTGAAEKGRYDKVYLNFRNFDLYRISIDKDQAKKTLKNAPRKLVYYIFKDNAYYTNLSLKRPDNDQNHQIFSVFPELLNLYLTESNESDHRNREIECQSLETFTLIPAIELLWIGVPQNKLGIALEWKKKWKKLSSENAVIKSYKYVEGITNPYTASHDLWNLASEYIEERYL